MRHTMGCGFMEENSNIEWEAKCNGNPFSLSLSLSLARARALSRSLILRMDMHLGRGHLLVDLTRVNVLDIQVEEVPALRKATHRTRVVMSLLGPFRHTRSWREREGRKEGERERERERARERERERESARSNDRGIPPIGMSPSHSSTRPSSSFRCSSRSCGLMLPWSSCFRGALLSELPRPCV